MIFQWCKKVFNSAKDTVKTWLPRPKPTPPLTVRDKMRAIISYIEQVTKRGAGVGENIVASGWYAFPTPVTPILYIPVGLFVLAAFFGKFFHRSESPIKRFVALLSRNFLKIGETVPALFSIGGVTLAVVGASLEPGAIGFIPVFFTGLALSFSKFLLDKKFAKKNPPATQTTDTPPLTEEAVPSKGRRFARWLGKQISKFPPLARNVLLPIFKKAGQGALLKKVFSFFIIALYQEEGWVNQNTEPAAATSPWLYLFVILPLAMKISLLIAEKATSSQQKRRLDNVDIGFEAITNGGESFALLTIFVAKVIGSCQANDIISDDEYFASMGVGALFGVLGTYFSLEKSLKQRAKEALDTTPDEESQIGMLADELAAEIIATRKDSPETSSYAVVMEEMAGSSNSTSREQDTLLHRGSSGSTANATIDVTTYVEDHKDTRVDFHPIDGYNMSSSLTEGTAVSQIEEPGDDDRALFLRTPPN